jgi:hypothetical protein
MPIFYHLIGPLRWKIFYRLGKIALLLSVSRGHTEELQQEAGHIFNFSSNMLVWSEF